MEQFNEEMTIDARSAAWLSASTPETVGYHASCGLRLPEREEVPHGLGPGWRGRAVAAVLRECYGRELFGPTLEEIEVAAISVLPRPEEDDGRPRPPFVHSATRRWEDAILSVSESVRTILRHGPASGGAGAEVLFPGGTLRAEVGGLALAQRVDLLWRRPGGRLEAVLILEEPSARSVRREAGEDWRCVLAAAAVRALYGENPDLHLVWVSYGAARVTRLPEADLDRKIGEIARVLEEAERFAGVGEDGEGVFYRLYGETSGALNGPVPGKRRRRRPSDAERRGTE